MKLAVITDSSAYLNNKVAENEHLFVLDIPVSIDGVEYIEGKNLSASEFYQKMAASSELPKTSQPSIASLVNILSLVEGQGYTHVIGLFLSSGISGFYQNIQYLKDEFPSLEIAFPDSKITSAPLGMMVEHILNWTKQGLLFEQILNNLEVQIKGIGAFIMVDDLNHLVKGGRLSNGAAILGNLLSIKPILYFNDEGVIEVYEKIRTEKKATKRLVEIVKEQTAQGNYQVMIIHGNAREKAELLHKLLVEERVTGEIPIATFGSVIGTHLGAGSIALAYIPIV
ncbi:DegV family protein [Streptococcus constellatus]|uniref:DegV family protein n=1 Tax=Streptococcus TaxID=1301 RepID=UPI00065FCBBC|nr:MULTISPECIES: DegV family protein [Streptococcus]MDK6972003.1 DegV family protein [Streptococcus constellatus]OFN56787.1 EDD domain protein [Streptococcus sp. HMSC034B05]PNM84620.1 EDD domain protein [Streptococcus sp. FDAARGOS_146]RID95689.1 DegV family protein [Streptococcus constellatus]VEE81009.1 degV family protein [Streptococcus milleri]